MNIKEVCMGGVREGGELAGASWGVITRVSLPVP